MASSSSSQNSNSSNSSKNISIEYYHGNTPPSIIFMTQEEFNNFQGDYMICTDCGLFVKEENILRYKKMFRLSFYEIKCITCCRLKELNTSPERLEALQHQRRKIVQQN